MNQNSVLMAGNGNGNTSNTSYESAEMAVARRKLRSHTRQNPGVISPLSQSSATTNLPGLTDQLNGRIVERTKNEFSYFIITIKINA